MNKPRPFNHQPIYIDERRERLEQVEQRAQHELGLAPAPDYVPASLHGVFTEAGKQRRKGRALQLFSLPMLLSVILVVLAAVLLVIFSKQ